MSYSELQGAVLAVAGIAAAEVEPRDDLGPSVRVWLDGSRPAARVSADLEQVLESAGFRAPALAPAAAPPFPGGSPRASASSTAPSHTPSPVAPIRKPGGNGAARRAGLGRGLDALIPSPDPDAQPAANRLEMIAIEESSTGTIVRAVDAAGRSAVAPVSSDRALNQAVAATVAGLLGFGGAPAIHAVEVRQLAGSSVLVIVVEMGGRRGSGSALIESGMPFALGTALWYALRSLS